MHLMWQIVWIMMGQHLVILWVKKIVSSNICMHIAHRVCMGTDRERHAFSITSTSFSKPTDKRDVVCACNRTEFCLQKYSFDWTHDAITMKHICCCCCCCYFGNVSNFNIVVFYFLVRCISSFFSTWFIYKFRFHECWCSNYTACITYKVCEFRMHFTTAFLYYSPSHCWLFFPISNFHFTFFLGFWSKHVMCMFGVADR